MAKKKNGEVSPKIPVKEIEVDGVYRTWVSDIVKIQKIDEDRQTVVLYNITGSFKQWVAFKNIYLTERLY